MLYLFEKKCVIFPSALMCLGEDRLRLNNCKKIHHFLAIVFGLHYLCRPN